MDWDAELIGLMAEFGGLRLARHAHLPLQSGSDAVLRRMHRRYRPWHYADKVAALLRAAGPALTLGADVMAGFPGENRPRVRRGRSLCCAPPFRLPASVPVLAPPRHPRLGRSMPKAPFPPPSWTSEWPLSVRSPRKKPKPTAAPSPAKRSTSLTLHTPAALQARGRTSALSENFLPVELAGRWPANGSCASMSPA